MAADVKRTTPKKAPVSKLGVDSESMCGAGCLAHTPLPYSMLWGWVLGTTQLGGVQIINAPTAQVQGHLTFLSKKKKRLTFLTDFKASK